MKNTLLMMLAFIGLTACTKNNLDRKTAFEIIKKESYPRVFHWDIYCGDPKEAAKVLNAGLEEDGFVTVQRTAKLGDIGKEPIVRFTDKAKPYLLETPEEDKKIQVQRVKIADDELIEVTGIQLEEGGKTAIVEYKTAYKNITPFAKLLKKDITQPNMVSKRFALYDDGWRMEKRR